MAKASTKPATKTETEKLKEPEVGSQEKTEDGKVKTYHGDGLFSIDN